MIGEHSHIDTLTLEQLTRADVLTVFQSKEYDPTHTTALRNQFSRAMDTRFDELVKVIKKAVDEDDCFGLKKGTIRVFQMTTPGHGAFNFPRSQDKVTAFMTWLQEQEQKGILEIGELKQLGLSVEGAWTNRYVFDSYKRGVIRSRYELQKAGFGVPSIALTGGIEISMATPFHLDRLGLLYSRTFSELKGVTASMDSQISRVLAQGIADGDNPRLLAQKLMATINGTGMGNLAITDTLGRFIPAQRRANMIARTEIIRAHHVATIQEYRNWAAAGVFVDVEWQTAGHEVCPFCEEMQGKTFTLDEIESMIPAHPNCRCCAIPVPVKQPLIKKVKEKKKAVPSAEVEFRNKEDQIQYNKFKKDYKNYFESTIKPITDKWTSEDWKEYRSVKGGFNSETWKMLDVVRDKLRKIPGFNVLDDWQASPRISDCMRLKYWAHKLEKIEGKMQFPDSWSTKQIKEFHSSLLSGDNVKWKNAYLKFRAFNQVYMEEMGIDNVVLYRGTDGKYGSIIRQALEDKSKMKRTIFRIADAPLAGYTSNFRTARYFGSNTVFKGIIVRVKVPRQNIFIHKELLSGVTSKMVSEEEFIILGGTKTISLKDILWKGETSFD